jgi:hypothetical protein
MERVIYRSSNPIIWIWFYVKLYSMYTRSMRTKSAGSRFSFLIDRSCSLTQIFLAITFLIDKRAKREKGKRRSISSKLSIMVIPNYISLAHLEIVLLNLIVKTSWEIQMVDILYLFLFLRSDLYYSKIAKGRLVLRNITSHWKIQRSTRSNTRCAVLYSLWSLPSSLFLLFFLFVLCNFIILQVF